MMLEILKVIFFLLGDVQLFFLTVGMLAARTDGGKGRNHDDKQRPNDK